MKGRLQKVKTQRDVERLCELPRAVDELADYATGVKGSTLCQVKAAGLWLELGSALDEEPRAQTTAINLLMRKPPNYLRDSGKGALWACCIDTGGLMLRPL